MEVGGLVAVQGQQVAEGVPVGQEQEHILGRTGRMEETLPLPCTPPGVGWGARLQPPLPTEFEFTSSPQGLDEA